MAGWRGPACPTDPAGPGEGLEQITQRCCGCPSTESIQNWVGWGLEQPGLVEDDPACK